VAGRGSGPQPALYPWGSDPTAGGQTSNLPQGNTYDVGTMAFNRSPLGVYDLIGTVWQWVDSPYAPVGEGLHILRGGRYGLLEDMAFRQPAKADDTRFTRVAGVRCAADRVTGE
jgi:formylglycine-generating enzyme required for sulfatase activity